MNKKGNTAIEEKLNSALQSWQKNNFGNAEKLYREILEVDSKNFEATFSLGTIFLQQKKFDEARELFLKAILINPNHPNTYNNLGIAMKELGQKEKSIVCFHKAIEIEPNHEMAHNNLGIAFKEKGEYKKAINSYKKAIEINPNNSDSLNNLGTIYTELGEHEKSANYFNEAIKIDPKNITAHTNLLFNICWLSNDIKYLEYTKRYYDIISKYEISQTFRANKVDKKFLKIGFVSGDFNNHPVTYFLSDTLKNLKKENIKLFAYNNNNKEDKFTESLKKNFDHWHSISDKNDKDTVELIRKDNLDILFDLSGHTKRSRLGIFKSKCAPIQATWSGWLASTGIKEIDYIIGDPYATPYSDQKKFIEKIYQLENIWQSLSISDFDPDVFPIKKNDDQAVVFGSFNNTIKLNAAVINTWSKILDQVPDSKIFLKYGSFDITEIKNNIIEKFVRNGINKNRIITEGRSPRDEYLKCYNKIDIALDTFPINGSTTNFEASYMGVPILTKLSENNAWFRSGVSINKNLKMDDWIAENEIDYVAKAVKFSENKKNLINLKIELRNIAFKSFLFDSDKFSKVFYKMLLDIKKK